MSLEHKPREIRKLMDELQELAARREEQHRQLLLLLAQFNDLEKTESRLKNELTQMWLDVDNRLNSKEIEKWKI